MRAGGAVEAEQQASKMYQIRMLKGDAVRVDRFKVDIRAGGGVKVGQPDATIREEVDLGMQRFNRRQVQNQV